MADEKAGTCSNCGATRSPDEAFCEVCGFDYATGQLPAPPPPPRPAGPAAPEWLAVIGADRQFFDSNESATEGVTVEFPDHAATREVSLGHDDVHIGRRNESSGSHPDIDIGDDPAASRRHAVLRRGDDGGWVVIDEGSTNGTRVDGMPIAAGEPVALQDGSFLHVGAWTRITVKRVKPATPA